MGLDLHSINYKIVDAVGDKIDAICEGGIQRIF